ncbi:adenylyl-sulfate kinase [Propionivibrio sp.]|uniref:adenylyl-sulfate kinase n=1 Tax=Propionivibrio sp. TaxID=2212460 RepID=UPI0025E224C3|nr:adenylyl-sulfate kinase [Propionivibrio sp.]MBK7354650.1 adenylyl-sulfate kinase [Propionivibrio sp.]MBK8402019.1 adenylyl-sulfate kinase [Propionivibrio sp.]MBK8743832.1 adenylyl-sulfate kinase [Propionivibrio sp.]MBK8895430.1 adenylyl-sulfate kinase [Propionivibrio sp.]MBL0206647.1 adenylyl-sulfate kinase [Propionivibrio sp.]
MAITIWLTGLSGSGKSTLANALSERLKSRGVLCCVIDGDELRRGLCADLSYSREDRQEDIRRAANVSQLLNAAGVTVVAALISPYRDDCAMARAIIGSAAFFDVYLETSLQVCEQRNPKGLYRQARSGLIPKFTGISDHYEPPPHPYLQFDTHSRSVAECLTLMQDLLTQ